ncbi:MAG: 4Fe-4S binding protein [Dehalogenimonas sp.]
MKASNNESYLAGVLNNVSTYKLVQHENSTTSYLYEGYDSKGTAQGYISVSDGQGYGGSLTVVMGWTIDGEIVSITVPRNHEDKIWFDRLGQHEYFSQYIGRKFDAPFVLKQDIDAVTGATVSSNGVIIGVREARMLVSKQLNLPYPMSKTMIKFGLAEILVIVGLVGVVLLRTVPSLKKITWLRYVSLAYGFGILGIWLVRPISLTNFATWMLGSPPNLATGLLLYILVFGVVGLALVLGKNCYCYWLCPFSAVQEITSRIGQGGIKPTADRHKKLRYFRYGILWVVLLLVFINNNPSVSVFEPWGTLFGQVGTYDQWLLLALTVALSVFVSNIWSNYLCPVGAFMDIVLKIRKEVFKIWLILTRHQKQIQVLEETSS